MQYRKREEERGPDWRSPDIKRLEQPFFPLNDIFGVGGG